MVSAIEIEEVLEIIGARIGAHERSNQVEIGPSGLGTPCLRKLGYRLAQHPSQRVEEPPWRPTVGTAVHSWLAEMLEAENRRELREDHADKDCPVPWCDHPATGEHTARWRVELRVPCGTIEGTTVYGTIDVYDHANATVLDWKVVGPTALKNYRRHGPEEFADYRVQVHVYGRGASRALRLVVEHVAIMFLPMNGELSEAWLWSEPYDPEIGREAFDRARTVQARITERGPEYIAKLKRAPDHCGHCPWFDASNDTGDWRTCPGDPSMYAKASDSMADLV